MDYKSKIGIGSVQFGVSYGISNTNGRTSSDEVKRILDTALNAGINTIDTASAYGNAEEVLGNNSLGKFKIISKFMPPRKGETIHHQLYKSLEKLQVRTLYGFLAHRPLDLSKNPEHWEELKELRNNGVIQKIGYSLNEPSELDLLLRMDFFPDLIQAPFNYFDCRFAERMIELKVQGCEIHSRSSFLQGLFFADTNTLSSYFNEVKPLIKSLQESIDFLSGSLLKFVIEQTFIDKVIIGVENCNQLLTNLETIGQSSILPKLVSHIPERILVPSQWPQ